MNSHILLTAVKEMVNIGMYDRYVLIIPDFKNEGNEWLWDCPNHIRIFDAYDDEIAETIIEEQEILLSLHKKQKIERVPTVFFGIDDPTVKMRDLFRSQAMASFATLSRTFRLQSWVIVDNFKHYLPPKVRSGTKHILLRSKNTKKKERCGKIVNFVHDWNRDLGLRRFCGCLLIKNPQN